MASVFPTGDYIFHLFFFKTASVDYYATIKVMMSMLTSNKDTFGWIFFKQKNLFLWLMTTKANSHTCVLSTHVSVNKQHWQVSKHLILCLSSGLSSVPMVRVLIVLSILLLIALSIAEDFQKVYIKSVRCNCSEKHVFANYSCFAKSYSRVRSTVNIYIVNRVATSDLNVRSFMFT